MAWFIKDESHYDMSSFFLERNSRDFQLLTYDLCFLVKLKKVLQWGFKIQSSKSMDSKCFRVSNGCILDPHSTSERHNCLIGLCLRRIIVSILKSLTCKRSDSLITALETIGKTS